MKISKTQLLEALEIVKPGLASKEVMEQSTSFAFMGDRVITYNDEISISHPIKGLDLVGAVKAEELYKLLAKLKGDELEILLTEGEVILTHGKIKSGLTLQAEIKLPVQSIGAIQEWHDLPENFCEKLQFASHVCGNDMTRPMLSCIHVRGDGRLEASDGYRIVVYQTEELSIDGFLLPATLAEEVRKLKPFQIAEGEGWIHFRTQEDTVISCRLFGEDKYPAVDHLLEVTGNKLIFPKTITELIDRASVFSKRDNALDEVVRITIGERKLTIRSDSDTGWYEEEANMRYDGPEVKFSITPKLFKNILERTQECVFSENKIKFTGPDWIYIGMLRN